VTHLLNSILPCTILRERVILRHGQMIREALVSYSAGGGCEWVDARYLTVRS